MASGEWEQHEMRSAAHFLGWRLGLSPERAKQIVTVAERRSSFPAVVGAFDRGELSFEQVLEVVKAPAWADSIVLYMATISTVSKLRRAMRSKNRTRRIVERRDRGCRVPGCTADRFVEIHHIEHWTNGGATDTPNLVSLCRFHHRSHHHGELGISGNADQFDAVVFTDRRGRPIAGSAPPTQPKVPPNSPPVPYEPPLRGRFDWNWIGLGWTHPDELRRRRTHRRTQPDPTDHAA